MRFGSRDAAGFSIVALDSAGGRRRTAGVAARTRFVSTRPCEARDATITVELETRSIPRVYTPILHLDPISSHAAASLLRSPSHDEETLARSLERTRLHPLAPHDHEASSRSSNC
jgi:hypothetical protein